MPKLTFVLEDGQEIVVPLADRITVGSADENDVLVDDERISPCHAELLLNADGSVQLFDLKSATGTFVNGVRVISHTLLDGDKVEFGPLQAVLDLELSAATTQTATTAPVSAPSPKTARIKPSSATRRVEPVAPPPPPEPQPIPSEELRAAENRLALLEAAARQAETSQRDWLASIESLKHAHAEKSAAIAKLTAQHDEKIAALGAAQKQFEALTSQHDEKQAAIAAVQKQLDALASRESEAAGKLQSLQESIAQEEARLAGVRRETAEEEKCRLEAAATAARHQEEARVALESVSAASEKLAGIEGRIASLANAEEKLAQLSAACAEAEKRQAVHQTAIAGLQEERAHQEQALTRVEITLTEAQNALAVSREEMENVKRRVEELAARRAELEAATSAPMEEIQQRLEKARSSVAVLEARLRPLRDWKEAQDRRAALLSSLPPESAEARELLREIESESADLIHIVSIPPSRTPRVIQVEPPYFNAVPLKSGHTRLRQSTASDEEEEGGN